MVLTLTGFNDYLELFLNIIEALTLLVTITTFLYLMLNKFLKGLRHIFSNYGLSFFGRIRVLFICRKSFFKKRLFIEFAILKTEGQWASKKDWRLIINEFKNFFDENVSNYVYEIDNCTYLITDEFSEINRKYFNFLNNKKIKKIFTRGSNTNWVIKLKIKDAYVTPTCLISGLLSEYKQNWDEFIKRYVSVAFMKTNYEESKETMNVLTEELYFTFAWLLWGPSFEISYKDYWGGLSQLSFGDESNSMAVVFSSKNRANERIRDILLNNSGKKYGELISPLIILSEKNSFYESLNEHINPNNSYFYAKSQNNNLSFAAMIDDFELNTGFKSDRYYCTAYVWILFELETDSNEFHPENLVAFFEHANLADSGTYSFLVETLLNKAFLHFEKVFKEPKLNDRKYRFSCSLNSYITDHFIEKYNKIIEEDDTNMFKDRLIVDTKRMPSETFAGIDNFFHQDSDISFEEVDYSNKKTITDLSAFYTDIYIDSFPEDERETFDNLLHYLKANGENSSYKYHISLAKDKTGQLIGGAIYDYFSSINSGVIEFIVVKNNQQSIGLGSKIYSHVLNVLTKDSHAYKYKELYNIFCEIDSPESSMQKVKKYLYFWNKNNYKKIDFKYIQPSLSSTKDAVFGLWLVVSRLNTPDKNIDNKTVIEFLKCYLKYCMKIDDPDSNENFVVMKNELTQNSTLQLLDILPK